ncbi:MAG: tetratricopeptide repeat protein [Bacteroidales bacterium]|jgi:tetratricopeptide (TPR) repeat protein|nr:tetratricopeptide repeat protein [Bacteroidales bacterium]
MKRLSILSVITLLFVQLGFSQSDEFVLTWPIVKTEIAKADASVENPKKAAQPATWMEVGRKYLQLYTFDIKDRKGVQMIQPGLASSDVLFILGSPKSQDNVEDYTVFIYDRVKLFFKDNRLARYERIGDAAVFFPEITTALDKAAAAYLKAHELDIAGKQSKKISEQLAKIVEYYSSEMYYYYIAHDYERASAIFSRVGDIVATGALLQTKEERATTLNDVATVAKMAKDYEKAIKFFNKAIEISPRLPLYGEVYAVQAASGDTLNAISTLIAGLEAFPSDSLAMDYTTELINVYIQTKQSDKALKYLEKALEKEPNNVNFLYNIGVLYNERQQIEEAKAAYMQALAIDPNDEGSNLNLGLLFVSLAGEKGTAAEKAWKDKKTYDALKAERDALLKQALPFLQRYADVVTEPYQKRNALKDLRSIYAQLGMTKEEQAIKAQLDAMMK